MKNNDKRGREQRLVLRLPSDDAQPVRWLLGAADGQRSVARGSLPTGETDPELMRHIAAYPALVLVPATEFVFHRVTLPRRALRQVRQVLPFMLEEQLATDIDQLHFAVLQQQGDICEVAVVDKRRMRHWLARCEQLELRVLALLPDALALPLVNNGWSAVREERVWLFRRERNVGMAAEPSWLAALLAASRPLPMIHCYSAPPEEGETLADWRPQAPQDLLQLAAAGDPYRGADLRQGEFSKTSPWRTGIRPWRAVVLALTVYLLLLTGDAALSHYRLWQQAEHWRQESVRVYRQLFPAEKNVVNPRVQMQQHLQRLQPSSDSAALGAQMHQLQQLLADSGDVAIHALAYDASREELRIDLRAASYSALEQFQRRAAQRYRLQPGEMKQGQGGVESRLVLGIRHE